MPNLHARTVARAAALVGGVDVLAVKLSLPPEVLMRYLSGDVPVPTNLFLSASEILTEASVVDAAKVIVQPDRNPAT